MPTMNHKITAYSTALFSTWINIEDLNLLFDAGDGLSAGLLQKSMKVKYVFITHPDRDHLHGLPQFLQLNSRPNLPIIHYPKDSGSFPAIQDFLGKFDPHTKGAQWFEIEDGYVVSIKKGFEVQAIRNEHIACPVGVHKSLSYKVFETKDKLKPEFQALNSEEIKKIVQEKGRDFLTEVTRKNILSFSGDTPVDDYGKWDQSEILIHEATFLKDESKPNVVSTKNKHSTIDEVLDMVKEINIKQLILTHFSSRYSKEDIETTVRKKLKVRKIDLPVFIVYPGEISRDILAGIPVNG